MKLGRLKYGFKLGGRMMEKGTVVTLLPPDHESVKAIFPTIGVSETSNQIAVKFNHLSHPTILHLSEVEIIND